MIRVRWIVIIPMVLLTGPPVMWAESDDGTKLADRFTVRWSTIRYDKAVVLHNPEVSSDMQERSGTSETLRLLCRIEIGDPNLTLGTSRQGVITQLTDSRGRDVAVSPPLSFARRYYEGLQYRPRFTQPPAVPRWRAMVQSVLRLPPRNTGFRPQLVTELQPNEMDLRFDLGLLDQARRNIRRVKGYFYALMAESLENVEVRFEPNDNWVRLTADLEVQVREATRAGTSFRYRIETRSQGGDFMRPPTVGDPLPGRLVIAQEFLTADGKPVQGFAGLRQVPAHVGGVGGGGGDNQATKIRFVIAVNPTHCKIPFELQRIPLPNPEESGSQ